MKRAISVKYIPASQTKSSRLKAFDKCGNQFTVGFNSTDLSGENLYQFVAEQLAKKMNWKGKLIGGWLGNEAVFVFAD